MIKTKLSKFDDLFGQENVACSDSSVVEISLSDLHEFKGHPFKVVVDEKMLELSESIKENGVIIPAIARKRKEGGYELIAGHRRRKACELAGLSTMPVSVKELSDDEAVGIMVDTNIQREQILPSEKAKAYQMKYTALKHQGKSSGKYSLEELSEASGENEKMIQRYLWLARLSDELLELVDQKKLGFTQGVDISFLNEEMQEWVFGCVNDTGCSISISQSGKLKSYGKSGELTRAMVELILTEEKKKEKKLVLRETTLNQYFTPDFTDKDMEKVICDLLEKWQKEREQALSEVIG